MTFDGTNSASAAVLVLGLYPNELDTYPAQRSCVVVTTSLVHNLPCTITTCSEHSHICQLIRVLILLITIVVVT